MLDTVLDEEHDSSMTPNTKDSLSGAAVSRLKNDPDRLLRSEATEKAKAAGMTFTALLRALLRGYRDGKIEVEVPRVLVNEPEVK